VEAPLAALYTRIAARLPAIADGIVPTLLRHDHSLAAPEHERVCELLVHWMRSVLLGVDDEAFRPIRSRLARRLHEEEFLRGAVFAGLLAIRSACREHVEELYEAAEASQILAAIDRALAREQGLLLHHVRERERRPRRPSGEAYADRLLALRTLTAGLAHEVRNPLNSAKLQLEVLERRLRRELVDARFWEPTEQARIEIEKIAELLDELLAFANPAPLELAFHDMVAIARQAIDSLHGAAERCGIELVLAGAASAIAEVDALKVRTILQHLLANAVQAIERDGCVRVVVHARGDLVEIEVVDDGPGIPAEIRPRICEPFFSTHSGSGLGMSIVHSMVTLHGGSIDIQSEPGSTAVAVSFPRHAS
jgi:signal transduction histidine kinase